MTDKESLTHEIEDDLAARNRNWNKVDRNTTNIADNTTNITQNTNNIEDNYKALEDFMNIPPLALKRVDTLTGRMQITSTIYTSPNVVPLKEPYGENLYLICFEINNIRNAPSIIWTGNSASNAAGQILVGADATKPVIVSVIRSGNNVGFYSVVGTTDAVYVTGIYQLD